MTHHPGQRIAIIGGGLAGLAAAVRLVEAGYEPVIIEKTQADLEALIALLQQELFDIRGETAVLNRDLVSVREQTSTTKVTLARLQGELDTVQGQYAVTVDDSAESVIDEGDLEAARQSLTAEMMRLRPYYDRPANDAVAGGCPRAGDCCVANGSPGCDDATCCTAICAIDPFCCDVSWADMSADEANADAVNCPQCQPVQSGACCVGTDCVVVTEAACAVKGGTYQIGRAHV